MNARQSVLVALAGLFALSTMATKAVADNEKGTAVIKGKVVFDGEAPKPKGLPAMTSDPVCEKANPKPLPDQATIVYAKQGNAIPYVFVYVKEGIKGKYDAPKEAAVIDQKGCTYHPHVFGMVAGQTLDIKSSDPTTHNIHALPKKNTEFNISQPKTGVMPRTDFTKPEMGIKIKCDVHGWMSAWCHVMSHPFFDVTKDHIENADESKRGTFEIKNLPAGEYEIEAWHETFGTVSQKVTVKDGETKEIEFKMKAGIKKAESAQPSRTVLASSVTETAKPACCTKDAAKVVEAAPKK